MSGVSSAAEALKRAYDTGDRAPFAALLAPGCVNWHNHDKRVVPSSSLDGAADSLSKLVEGLHIDIVQHEILSSGELIRIVFRGTVRSTGLPLEAHNCIVLTSDATGITRIDDYVDPTMGAQLGFGLS
jgi:ketosteroid isomerase-like protein